MTTPTGPVGASGTSLRVLGIGMGPQHLTPEVVAALRGSDYVLAADKRPDADGRGDPLLDVRRAVCAAHGVDLVAVPDPERDRADPADYPRAVRDWHEARVAAYEEVLRARPGTVAMLVWGDSSLYDSTLRVVAELSERLDASYDVLPGISAPQMLAARHRLVLNDVGGAVHVTTGRRVPDEVAAGADNLVVMLNRDLSVLEPLGGWRIWWGANIGAAGEQLVAGRVGEVLPEIEAARERARSVDGWVMDVYLLRRG